MSSSNNNSSGDLKAAASNQQQQSNAVNNPESSLHGSAILQRTNSHIEQLVQQKLVKRNRYLSERSSSSNKSKTEDFEGKINRLYSFLLVKYHWVFLLIGITTTVIFTGVSFVKQPLPNFLDPKRGFGARGEGTLTSKLIVLKNINTDITSYNKKILEIYDQIKMANRSDFDASVYNNDDDDSSNNNNNSDFTSDTNSTDSSDSMDDDPDTDQTDELSNDISGGGGGGDEEAATQAPHDEPPEQQRVRRDVDVDYENSDELITGTNFKYKELMEKKIYRSYTGVDILKMLPKDSTVNVDQPFANFYAFDAIEHCNYSLGLGENLEFYFTSAEIKDPMSSIQRQKSSNKTNDAYFADMDNEYNVNSDRDYDDTLDEDAKEAYFREKEENLFNLKKLHSLCQWDRKLIKLLMDYSFNQRPCYFSLPFVIALLNNKTDCMAINGNDVRNFLQIVRKCYHLQQSGILYAAAQEFKPKSEIIALLNKNNPITTFVKLNKISQNICFKKNLMHIVYEYLIDKDFLQLKPSSSHKQKSKANDDSNGTATTAATTTADVLESGEDGLLDEKFKDRSFVARISALWVMNDNKQPNIKNNTPVSRRNIGTKIYDHTNVYPLYEEYFHKKEYDDGETKLLGINLMGIREDAAMHLLSRQVVLVGVAITLIVIVTLLYLKSIFIAMLVNAGVAMSLGVSFFTYRIVFDIDLFPFINAMAAFLLIGIACDDIYVLFDAWYAEKSKIIMQDLGEITKVLESNEAPSSENEDQQYDKLPKMFIRRHVVKEKNPNNSNSNGNKNKKAPKSEEEKMSNTSQQQQKLNGKTKSNNFDDLNQERESFILNDGTASNAAMTQSLQGNTSYDLDLVERNETVASKPDDLDNYELNPSFVRKIQLTDEQLIRVMGGTLRHAASSIFVTSFTTAAAFLTNMITKLPYVQLFGFFTGMCILIYFLMVITMVAAFAVTYDKYLQHFHCKVRPKCTLMLERRFEKTMHFFSNLNHKIIEKMLPQILIKLRIVWFLLFLTLGVAGLFAVFYYPQLKPPASWRFQFFRNPNLFEEFEFYIRDQFASYINEERRNLTNPEIFFVFGIMDKDNGRIFNPEDGGYLVHDTKFDFLSRTSQTWINGFINTTLKSRPDLFLADEIVNEWRNYLFSMQTLCYKELDLDPNRVYTELFFPYDPVKLSKCRDVLNNMLLKSTVANFESMMSSFPRRIIFLTRDKEVKGLLLRIDSNRTFVDYDTVDVYYTDLKAFTDGVLAEAPDGFKTGWFTSVAFALYDLQHQLISGTYSSLIASMAIALIILLLTSGNILISIYAIITISFSIADTIAIFVFMGWNLSFLESIVIIMSVGLSVDFSCHYGVAYIKCDLEECYANQSSDSSSSSSSNNHSNNNTQKTILSEASETNKSTKKKKRTSSKSKGDGAEKSSDTTASRLKAKNTCLSSRILAYFRSGDHERFTRINDIFERVGSAVLMAAFTTFLAGVSMSPSGLMGFAKMGEFLMLVMFLSYVYATFFFVPMCALFGPTRNFGDIKFKWCFEKLCSMFCSCLFKESSTTSSSSSTENKNEAPLATIVEEAPQAASDEKKRAGVNRAQDERTVNGSERQKLVATKREEKTDLETEKLEKLAIVPSSADNQTKTSNC